MKQTTSRRLVRIMAAVLLVASVLPALPTLARAAEPCGDIQLVWARGSGETFGTGLSRGQFTADLASRLPTDVVFSVHELGDVGFGGFSYPAWGDLATLADGLFPILPGSPYADSVAQGRGEFDAYLANRAAACPNEVFVVGGWSQGAQVIGSSLQDLTSQVRGRIAYVALFGDPTLQTGNTFGPFSFPAACATGERPWVRGSAPCWISGGIFGPRDPYVPSDIELRVGSWCRILDGVCEGSLVDLATSLLPPVRAHFAYFDPDSDSAFAAQEAAEALKIFVPAHAAGFDVSWSQFVFGAAGADLAFVFDTTGSMSSAIANAKTEATNLAQTWLNFFRNGRVGLVEFKDQGDPFVSRVDLGLTNDVSAFQNSVNALTASGGGDIPEAQLSGVMTALDGMAWANGATKVTIVITDAPGKDPEPITGFTRDSVSQHALAIDPVTIYGVNVSGGSDVSAFMQPLATATAGQVFVLGSGQTLSDALFDVLDAAHAAPVAKLRGPYVAPTGTPITFDAGDSFDASASITSYEWDFDSNGSVDRVTSTPQTIYTYAGTFLGQASVRVIGSDGRSSIATADVTVDSVGLGNLLPVAPTAASASVTGNGQVTVTWTPAASDRADGYKIYLAGGIVAASAFASDPHSVVIDGLNLSQPISFEVRATNGYGTSAAAVTQAVGGGPTGAAKAWGSNSQGQLGSGGGESHTPVNVATLTGITSIAGGAEHSLAARSDGSVWAWGQNANGELGDGTTTDRATPIQIPGLTGVIAVAAGTAHSLILKSDGTVWSFGLNQNGQLGDGTTTQRTTPVRVSNLTGVVAIAAGSDHSVALKSDGTVWAWGKNTSGQLGDGSKQKRTTPVRSGTLTGIVGIAAGGDDTLALKSVGTVMAWGYNFYGQLGDGTTTNRTSPVAVLSLTGVAELAAGSDHSLARKADGTVWAWGNNGVGQLGDGTTTSRSSPVRSGSLAGVAHLAAGAHHSLALKTDGSVWAWGYNLFGQLGNGTTTNATTAIQVSGLAGATRVAGGAFFSLAVL
jgi:alpha-tubulin suppressor-like RCC1 family protein